MTRWLLALLCLLAAAAGAAAGRFGPQPRRVETRRPAGVEAAQRMLDQYERDGNRTLLAAALRAAEPSRSFPSPWRDEMELVEVVAAGDDAGLWAFATERPAGPAPARALRLLAANARDPEAKSRAAQRFASDYPHSWAAGRIGRVR